MKLIVDKKSLFHPVKYEYLLYSVKLKFYDKGLRGGRVALITTFWDCPGALLTPQQKRGANTKRGFSVHHNPLSRPAKTQRGERSKGYMGGTRRYCTHTHQETEAIISPLWKKGFYDKNLVQGTGHMSHSFYAMATGKGRSKSRGGSCPFLYLSENAVN